MQTSYTVVIDQELDGRAIASIPGVPGCHAYGRTPREAVRKAKNALRFYLKEVLRSGDKLPKLP